MTWDVERGFGASTYRRNTDRAQIEIDARDRIFGDDVADSVTTAIDELVERLENAGVTRLEVGIPRIEP